jgi:hypothetical protein
LLGAESPLVPRDRLAEALDVAEPVPKILVATVALNVSTRSVDADALPKRICPEAVRTIT